MMKDNLLKQIKECFDSMEDEIYTLREDNNYLDSLVTDLKNENSKLEKELREYKAEVESQDEIISDYTSDYQIALNDIEALKSVKEELEEQNTKLIKALDNLQDYINEREKYE